MLIAKDNEFSGPLNNSIFNDKKALSEEEFYSLIDNAEKTAVNLTEDMLSGNIMPRECDNCKYCEYSSICGIKSINKEDGFNA